AADGSQRENMYCIVRANLQTNQRFTVNETPLVIEARRNVYIVVQVPDEAANDDATGAGSEPHKPAGFQNAASGSIPSASKPTAAPGEKAKRRNTFSSGTGTAGPGSRFEQPGPSAGFGSSKLPSDFKTETRLPKAKYPAGGPAQGNTFVPGMGDPFGTGKRPSGFKADDDKPEAGKTKAGPSQGSKAYSGTGEPHDKSKLPPKFKTSYSQPKTSKGKTGHAQGSTSTTGMDNPVLKSEAQLFVEKKVKPLPYGGKPIPLGKFQTESMRLSEIKELVAPLMRSKPDAAQLACLQDSLSFLMLNADADFEKIPGLADSFAAFVKAHPLKTSDEFAAHNKTEFASHYITRLHQNLFPDGLADRTLTDNEIKRQENFLKFNADYQQLFPQGFDPSKIEIKNTAVDVMKNLRLMRMALRS
ncbi:MAG: hypothetical protein ACRYGK_00080, partial [Janthinobacterium lividum]